jgi:hypothetical protein
VPGAPTPGAQQPGSGAPLSGGPAPKDPNASSSSQQQNETTGGPPPPSEEEKDATSTPGRASSRQGHVRAAQQTFAGDSVGGDKYVFYVAGSERIAPLTMLSPTLDELARRVFVAPPGWDECRLAFQGRPTVILRGQAGHGRHTMAVRLLQSVQASVIYQLDPRVDIPRMIEQISSRPIDRGAAFLLSQPADVAGLTSFAFERLEKSLADADARLVVTVAADSRLHDEGLLRYQLDLPEAPSRRDILRNHLDFRLDEERADQILRTPDVETLVAEKLDADGTSCEVAVFLAFLLAQFEPVDTERVRGLMQRRGTDEFDIWFDGLPDTQARCLAIALAVLDGLPFEEVSWAARGLHDRLTEKDVIVLGGDTELRPRPRDPFQLSSARLARSLQARLTTGPDRGSPMTIAYRDHDYPRQVVERAWHGFLIQDELLDWLGWLCAGGSEKARVFANTTLGVLATHSFAYIRDRVLHSWAASNALWQRESVADALRVVAEVPALRPEVRSLVDGWFGQLDEPLLQSTAALAHGTRLGADDPASSFDHLWRLAVVDDTRVHIAIGRGLAGLLADDAERLAPQIYNTIQRCLADRKRVDAGHWAFLIVANDVVVTQKEADRDVRWPALLQLAAHHEHLRDPLADLWAQVLTDGHMVDAAHAVARNWASFAEPDAGIRDAFVRVARHINYLDPRAGAALAYLVRQWNSDDELQPLPQIARSVERVLAP